MRAGYKECPRCAETIKAGASICRHCGHEFSASEFAKVDRLITRAASGRFVNEDDCQELAEELGIDPSSVRQRAVEIGFKYDDGTEESAHKRQVLMEAEAARLSKQGPLTPDVLKYLASEYGFSERSVKAKLHPSGLRFDYEFSEDIDDRDDPADTSGTASVILAEPDNQYGVLQGAANLAGGCVTWWIWAIILFLIAAVLAAIFG